MANYFNTLPLREKLNQLGVCEFMDRSEFANGVTALEGKKIVVVGCGAQGLNQGLNLRDSGLDVSYALRQEAIDGKRQSWKSATENNFTVGTYEELIPSADLVINLTPDKQHTAVVSAVMPLMKEGATLSYRTVSTSLKKECKSVKTSRLSWLLQNVQVQKYVLNMFVVLACQR
jgi:ketol-acid reductoisomerase